VKANIAVNDNGFTHDPNPDFVGLTDSLDIEVYVVECEHMLHPYDDGVCFSVR
jgi:hypothetical protein